MLKAIGKEPMATFKNQDGANTSGVIVKESDARSGTIRPKLTSIAVAAQRLSDLLRRHCEHQPAVCMLVNMYGRALCLAPLLLSGVSFAAPHLVARQLGDGRFINQIMDKFQEWRQQYFPGGKSDPRPETVPSRGLPGEPKSTPKFQPDPSTANPDIEIIIEAPVECGDGAPNMPSTECSQIGTSDTTREKIIPLDCSNSKNDRVRVLEQENAIESALQSFFLKSSDWKAESQLCGVLYYTASLTPSQIEKLQSIIDPPTIVPDYTVEAPIEPGASSAGDTRISPFDTRLHRPSGENLAPFPAPLENDQKPTEFYPKHPELEEEQQLKTPSPFSSPDSRDQSGEQRESRLYGGESTVPNDKIERLHRRRRAGT